ncbi:hypothetical protein [Nocardioides sp.]|uniref:hypothetical protein n=1 Tax=Nocardioides sp. TaxID=35761 RepID=UPI0035171E54
MQLTITPRGLTSVRDAAAAASRPIRVSDFGEIESLRTVSRYGPGFGGWDTARVVVRAAGRWFPRRARPGDHAVVTVGGVNGFVGLLSEAQPLGGGRLAFHLKGYGRKLDDFPALFATSGALAATTQLVGGNLSTTFAAWEYAVTQGLPITQIGGGTLPTGSVSVGAPAGNPTLAEILTAHLMLVGKRWKVLGRSLIIGADPTTVRWRVTAPDDLVAATDTRVVTTVRARYTSSGGVAIVTATDPTLAAVLDGRAATVDLRGLGTLTAPQAQARADALLELDKAVPVFDGSIRLTPGSGITTRNGTPVRNLASITAGDLVKIDGLRASQRATIAGTAADTVVIGRAVYDWSAEAGQSLTITPLGGRDRSLAEQLTPIRRESFAALSF